MIRRKDRHEDTFFWYDNFIGTETIRKFMGGRNYFLGKEENVLGARAVRRGEYYSGTGQRTEASPG